MKAQFHFTLVAAALLAKAALLQAQTTAFTYQGRLNDRGNPANGIYDFQFAIYDALSGGNSVAGMITNGATSVSNGLFTTTLDFGNAFPGADRWLDIAVRTNGGGAFIPISPRQALTPTPYAITAGRVLSGGLASGIYGNAVTFSNGANSFSGSFSGNGAAISNVNAATLGGLNSNAFWRVSGNAPGGGQFLGTTNTLPLELRANNLRGLRLEGLGNGFVNVIGGSVGNAITNGSSGSIIGGGGAPTNSFFFAPHTIGSDFSTIGGGNANHIETGSGYSTVAGGIGNNIGNNADSSTLSGGLGNSIADGASYGTIPGGSYNVAGGINSFAAGRRAKAMHSGAFVWADPQDVDFTSTGVNQFLVRAGGGVGINTTNPAAALDVNGSLRVGAGTTIFHNLQGGVAQMSSGSGTAKANFTFTFPKAFTSVPNVILSARSGNISPVDDTFAVTVRDVTATTCTVNVVRVDTASGWSQLVKIDWLAWE